MTSKLYVGNLSRDATEHGLRRHFASCGGVYDVEILTDRRGDPKGLAWVTMTSAEFAARAVERLDGVDYEGRALSVSSTPPRERPQGPTVKIAQQFRERNNMTYDLDCAGAPLTVRIFPMDDDQWRLEARTSDATDAVVLTACAKTRHEALREIGRDWRERAASLCLPTFDWDAIATAMSSVRAL